MAFSRMAIYGDQQLKGFIDVAFEITVGFSGVVKTSSLDQTNDDIMNNCQDAPRGANRHASRILTERHITAIMQASLNQPMFTSRLEHSHRRGLLPGKAGDPELDFTACFVAFALPEPDKLALETIDLSNPGPVEVIIQHGAGLDGAYFEPSMSIIGFMGGQEIGLDLSKARFWLPRSVQALNIFIQTGLVLLDRPEVISAPGHNLLRDRP